MEKFFERKVKKEILFSTYLCHPSLANNELSGPILATLIYKWLVKKKDIILIELFLFLKQ